ncbi:MAG: Ku protein [Planctomycetota bacterium]
MPVRAMWKATLVVGETSVPVALYAAAEDTGVHFRLLHRADLEPLTQKMVDPRTGQPVERAEMRRGVEVAPGRFVSLTEEELAELEPEASREIRVSRFVAPSALDPRWYERPYFLGPADAASEGDYFALAQAMEETGLEGIAQWTMRKRSYAGALRLHDGRLALVALRSPEELVATDAFGVPAGRELDEREVQLAHQLVDALAAPFVPDEFPNEFTERVVALVEAKLRGEALPSEAFEPAPEPEDESLAGVLEQSLSRAG